MLGSVYMFESDGSQRNSAQAVSVTARLAIEASINERPGIRYQELTEPANPKPVFALLFADPEQKSLFERLFEPALKLSGLRVTTVQAPAEAKPADARKAELGYIDSERGYAILIPTLPKPLPE